MDRLTIEQLKNYLGTGLKIAFDYEQYEYDHELVGIDLSDQGIQLISPFGDFGRVSIDKISLRCYRLSDLDKFIPELGLVPIEELYKLGWSHNQIGLIINGAYTHAAFDIIQILFEWHFWVFDQSYFDKRLIIDKLTYK